MIETHQRGCCSVQVDRADFGETKIGGGVKNCAASKRAVSIRLNSVALKHERLREISSPTDRGHPPHDTPASPR